MTGSLLKSQDSMGAQADQTLRCLHYVIRKGALVYDAAKKYGNLCGKTKCKYKYKLGILKWIWHWG